MTPDETTAVKVAHEGHGADHLGMCSDQAAPRRGRCTTYRFAVEAERLAGELTTTQRAARLLGEIVSRDGKWICEIAGVSMPADGDADYEVAWERVRAMPAEIARLAGKVARVEVVRGTMGTAAEAWTVVNPPVSNRLRHFSDEIAAALADQPESDCSRCGGTGSEPMDEDDPDERSYPCQQCALADQPEQEVTPLSI